MSVAGDHGDPDLRMVLNRAQSDGKPIPLVVFGHMHHKLYHASGFRQMVHIEGNGTVLLNAAVVPRWVAQPSNGRTGTVKQHQFTVVELVASVVQTVTQVWVGVADSKCWIADTKTIVKSEASNDGNFVRSYAVPDQSGAGPATRLWSEKDMWFTVAHSAASCSPLDINASCTRT